MRMRDVQPPDLEMRVKTVAEHGGTKLIYTLHSPTRVVPFDHQEIAGLTLAGSPKDYQARLLLKMERLGQQLDVDGSLLLRADIKRKLANLGRDLWRELFPVEIRNSYREIRRSVRSWMIVSDELWIPWELIRPYDDSRPQDIIDDDFLVFQFELTRWLAGARTPAREIVVRSLATLLTATDLPRSKEEQSLLEELAKSNPGVIDTTPAVVSASDLLSYLETHDVELIHFIAHHTSAAEQADEFGVLLLDGSVFRLGDLEGPVATRIRRTRPLVFLNNCSPGWAFRWVNVCGCGAFVAPLWPVRDKAALIFARAFYYALAHGSTLGQATLEARRSVREELKDDLFALAYSIYGHPNARVFFGGDATVEAGKESASGNLSGAINDQAAERDQLGFEDYAEVFAELIESIETQLPLTIGIFGSWGIGKTTLMELLKKKLRSHSQRPRTQSSDREPTVSCVHVITFSAWEYSASEAIWPGLARKIMDGLEKEISWPFPGRFLTKLGWNLRSALKKERGRIVGIGCILLAAAAAGVTLFLERDLANEKLWKPLLAAGLTGLAGIVGGALKIIGDTLSRPMGQWLTTAFQGDVYGRPISHFTRIREDLEFLDKRLRVDKKRLERALILIDDLDRCEPEKAVEMLQAIKLLLDFKSFVVCLGIDARIITRAIEKHYKDLLGEAGASGYEYLDKVVQIPFRIPLPERKQIEEFLTEQMGNPQPPRLGEPDEEVSETTTEAVPPPPDSADTRQQVRSKKSPPPSPSLSPPRSTPSAFTHRELQAFQGMVECLRPNPRHLKRLLNVYRLVRTLADLRGEQILLDKPGAAICWVVLCAQWPYTTHLMLRRLRQAEEEKDFQFPSEDPLIWLLKESEEGIDAEVRKRLDQDPDLLLRLIQECPEARMSWEELRTIRRYTINFNPAIELEAMAEVQRSKPSGEIREA